MTGNQLTLIGRPLLAADGDSLENVLRKSFERHGWRRRSVRNPKAANVMWLGAIVGLIQCDGEVRAGVEAEGLLGFEYGDVPLAELRRDGPAVRLVVVQR